VATILERSVQRIIDKWLALAETDEKLMRVSLAPPERSGHLPRILDDLVKRLRSSRPLASNKVESVAAREHGALRRGQGYSAAMMVEEARLLQVCVFETLQANWISIDFSVLLPGVMTIADEIDSQLSQAMASFAAESFLDSPLERSLPHERSSPRDWPRSPVLLPG
jgi:hypothetical protein